MSEEQSPNIDLVVQQLVTRSAIPVDEPSVFWQFVTWAMPGLAVSLAVIFGVQQAYNPVDQAAQCLVLVPLAMVLVDVWVLGAGVLRRRSVHVLWLPLALGIGHTLLWVWSAYLAQFEVFYRAEPTGPHSGMFVVSWGVIALLSGSTLVALASSVFAAWRTVTLLGAEEIPIGEPTLDDGWRLEALGNDAIFDAQALLTNLGYDVGGINGELSDATVIALKKFQADAGLFPNGDVTTQTLDMLYRRGTAQDAPFRVQAMLLFVVHISQSIVDRIKTWCRRRK